MAISLGKLAVPKHPVYTMEEFIAAAKSHA
jgi:hypothetical protein